MKPRPSGASALSDWLAAAPFILGAIFYIGIWISMPYRDGMAGPFMACLVVLSLLGFAVVISYGGTPIRQTIRVLMGVLLVVLLFTVTFPLLASSAPARRMGSISNIKQAALAVMSYAADHDDKLPLRDTWEEAVRGYDGADVLRKSQKDGRMTMSVFAFDMSPEQRSSRVLMYYSTQIGPNSIGTGADPFWTRSRSVVAFGDGSARSVSREEFGALPWRADQREATP